MEKLIECMQLNNSHYTKEDWSTLLTHIYSNKHSALYRNLYNANNFDPTKDFNALSDIEKIPTIDKRVLTSAKQDELRFVAPDEVDYISCTSGTTGKKPLVTFITPNNDEQHIEYFERDDFGANLVLFNASRAGALMYLYHNAHIPALVGDIHNLPATCALAQQAGVQTITTTPTLAIILSKYIEQFPDLLTNLHYLRLGGETLSPAKKKFIQNLYPTTEILNIYASSELGRIASQDKELSKQTDKILLRPHYEDLFFEVIDGELVVTTFNNKATPLVRYKTGDLVEVHETDDESGPLISILGRKDHDMVRAGGFEIKKDSIEKSLLSINHLVSNNFILTVHETYKNQKPFLTFSLQIELKEKDENKHAEIMKFIEDHLVATLRFSTTMSFKQAQEQGFFGDITITSTTFPEQAKSAQQIILEQIYEE